MRVLPMPGKTSMQLSEPPFRSLLINLVSHTGTKTQVKLSTKTGIEFFFFDSIAQSKFFESLIARRSVLRKPNRPR